MKELQKPNRCDVDTQIVARDLGDQLGKLFLENDAVIRHWLLTHQNDCGGTSSRGPG